MTDAEKNQLSCIFKALGHPIRLGIMELLESGSINSHELYEQLGCSQSVMSQHLKILKDSNLLTCHKEGASKYCSIDSSHLRLLLLCAQETLRETIPCKKDPSC